VPEDGLRRLLAVCAGKDFEACRDTAIITLLLDTGARSGEFAGLTLSDVDFDLAVLLVLGRVAESGHRRSAERRPWRWTATCGRASVTRKPT
jgi:integrase